MFGILFIYMVICLVMYLTTKHVTAYEVTAGPLSGNYRYTALALKSETIIKADQNGSVSYYAREGGKVGKGNNVCSIDETGKMAVTAENATEELTATADSELLSKIRSNMSSFSADYNGISYQSVYNFKADTESSILELTSEMALSELEAGDSGVGSSLVDLSSAPQAGIVVYSIDGYENLEPADVKSSDFDLKDYQKKNLRLNKTVSTGDSLYKLLTDETWTLMIPLDKKMATELADRENIRFRFLKDSTIFTAGFQILQNADGYYGELQMRTSLPRYPAERYLDIELILNRMTGLKIPNSAIAKKEFYVIPKEYAVYNEDNPKEISVLKRVEKKDGSFTSKNITAVVYEETDTAFYLEGTLFSDGDIILMKDSSKQYVMDKKKSLEGVYNINKGYAVFREIKVLDVNEEYCIVQEGSTFGLAQYDHIVLDASTVNDQDIIY